MRASTLDRGFHTVARRGRSVFIPLDVRLVVQEQSHLLDV